MVRMKMGLASREDDYAIRECLRNNEMPGQISIAFETEPSYFDALSVQGSESQVMVGRSDEGEIMGFGTRSFKSAYVNGKVIDIGYLGGLRVRPEFRNGIGLVKAYRYLRELNDDGRVPFYLTTIIEDNFEARHFLESGKMGLPNYHQLDVLSTFMIKPRKKEPEGLIEIVGGDSFDIEEILEFVNDEGSNKQFSPHYDISDFKGDRFRGLSQSDFYVAVDGGEIMGTLARWDQESFKQTRIVGYDAKLSFARPFINAISRFSNIPNLPPVGNIINYSYLAIQTVKG
ncbi:MAG: GNAT family N-acetyltransferase, partial [Nanoarchaeota archaeon]|nr:GNAT family N-acetyltransferase [Nanoarchaeota archaeon]